MPKFLNRNSRQVLTASRYEANYSIKISIAKMETAQGKSPHSFDYSIAAPKYLVMISCDAV